MEHILDETRLHAEIKRVLRPTGRALHVVPSQYWSLLRALVHYPMTFATIVRRFSTRRQNPSEPLPLPPIRSSLSSKLLNVACIPRHGETGTRLTERYHFRASSWHYRFTRLGWEVLSVEPAGLLLSGHGMLGDRLGVGARRYLDRTLGQPLWSVLLRAPQVYPDGESSSFAAADLR
jgi:hypothetical protein